MTDHRLLLYDEQTAPLQTGELCAFLQQTLSAQIELRGEYVGFHQARVSEPTRREQREALAHDFAYLRVRKVEQPDSFAAPLPLEIEVERRRLQQDNRGSMGMALDGFAFQARLREMLARSEAGRGWLHVVFTNRLPATWEEDDRRYHLRSIILGQPAIVSTSGLVEAPAKPREYYFLRQNLPEDELARAELRRSFAGRFLEHDDPRLTEAAKGYLLQAAFYHFFGEAFCPNRDCRLFNAHWQEELLHAQLRPGAGLCDKHERRVQQSPSGACLQNK